MTRAALKIGRSSLPIQAVTDDLLHKVDHEKNWNFQRRQNCVWWIKIGHNLNTTVFCFVSFFVFCFLFVCVSKEKGQVSFFTTSFHQCYPKSRMNCAALNSVMMSKYQQREWNITLVFLGVWQTPFWLLGNEFTPSIHAVTSWMKF